MTQDNPVPAEDVIRAIRQCAERKVAGVVLFSTGFAEAGESRRLRGVDQGVECVVGVARDPVFGPVVMFGIGGILIELMRNVSFRLAPVNRAQALAMIRETKGAALSSPRAEACRAFWVPPSPRMECRQALVAVEV